MKDINERLDYIEEILQLMVNKLTAIEKGKTIGAEFKLPDYTEVINRIEERVSCLPDMASLEKLKAAFNALEQKIKSVPAEIPTRHHHHFDTRSRGFIIGAVILLLVTAISAGLSLSLWSENQLLHENALKFRMIRVGHPGIANWADSTYYRNPEEAERITRQIEGTTATEEQTEDTAKHKGQTKKSPETKMPGRTLR